MTEFCTKWSDLDTPTRAYAMYNVDQARFSLMLAMVDCRDGLIAPKDFVIARRRIFKRWPELRTAKFYKSQRELLGTALGAKVKQISPRSMAALHETMHTFGPALKSLASK